LPRRISIIAAALRQIISGALRCLGSYDRARRPTCDRTDQRAARSPRQEAANQAARNGASHRARGRIRGWGRCIGYGWWRVSRRRRITCGDGRSIRVGDLVYNLEIGHISRWPFQSLRIKIPGASDIPPPTVASVAHFVVPASTLPSQATVIRVSAEIARWQSPPREMPLWPSARHGSWMPGTRVACRPSAGIWFLRKCRLCKHDDRQ
jgi:hypothetical protein